MALLGRPGTPAGEPHRRPGLLADFILGSQDGLVNVLGVILGVAIASQDIRIIIAGGLAATFAESISMGAVAYTATRARRDHYLAEEERERREMKELPEREKQEVREILERWGFVGAELEDLLAKIVSKEKAWLEIMMAHELFLAPVSKEEARKSAVVVGLAALVGSFIPLTPFLIFRSEILYGIAVSLAVSAAVLFMIGWYKAKTTVGRPGWSGLEMTAIGMASALAGFAIAYAVGVA